ncbi:MAG TPA: response regulator transcription factor [Prolixibacteraceae bacterium]|nr:response regulator transcription factor [Prolixibacteraceae bacterium]
MISNLTKKPDIIIVDDNLNFRQGLIFLITVDNVASVIGKASNEKEFIEMLSVLRPDVVLMDIYMLQKNGMEAARRALQIMPDLKIIAFTMFGDEEYYDSMNKLGIKGFLLKSGGIYELEKAIEEVVKGKNYISEQLVKKIIINYTRNMPGNSMADFGLTALESDIMQLICQGATNEDIAQKLSLTLTTVKENKATLLQKVSSYHTEQEAYKETEYMLN